MMRIGQGYDVHRLVEGRDLYLCGVRIPYEYGLDGHSDADVALHALCDALLGAAAAGDIGRHFPDNDDTYKGISSMLLLKKTAEILAQKGYAAVNADITIIAQRPKIAPYTDEMSENIASALGVDKDRINVKGTTTEKLGFEGRGEGIAASAVCLIEKA
ncbi:MAG: 2-C-methyl-D-erythritol 2,4-cyclodiphosphate synthase [Oscillospiraceae bacterium]|nr:2-C-methyl-D-erythritol 2,4-cyclodiphosphate synthase [Oscillospiraceae bacterium]